MTVQNSVGIAANPRSSPEWCRANFYAVLRALEEGNPAAAPWGDSARLRDDPARLGQQPQLGFPTQDIQAMDNLDTAHGRLHRVQISNFGLLGPQGALPLHWTELAYQQAHQHKDNTFAEFLDVFHQRLFSLFYKAWAQAMPHIGLHRPQSNLFDCALHSLLGLPTKPRESLDRLPRHFQPGLAAHLASPQPTVERVRKGLSALLACRVHITECVGQWLSFHHSSCSEKRQQSGLGFDTASGRLGRGALLGRRCWHPQAAVRVVLGPLPWAQFVALGRGGRQHAALQQALGVLMGPEWHILTALAPLVPEIPSLRLRRGHTLALGRTAFLGRPAAAELRPVPLSFLTSSVSPESP